MRLLSLPLSLIVLLLTDIPSTLSDPSGAELQWPHNIPRGLKYFPEDEPLVKRGLEAHRQLARGEKAPTGVMRMSPDPNEMFFLDYWLFDESDEIKYTNGTESFLPPMLAHATSPNPRSLLHALQKRDFSCPSGFTNCAGVGRQYSCCANGSTCVIVQDTGLGDVGCCPSGTSCGSGAALGTCDTGSGYKSCPGSSNGGCCMPGFDCLGVGCKSTRKRLIEIKFTKYSEGVSVTTSTTTTTLGATTISACQASYQSCAASLGGGCCPSSQTCGTSNTCLGGSSSTTSATTTTTTAAAVIPVRPTGFPLAPSDSAVDPSITTTGTQLIAVCPSNYYFCSAYYRPGCCQIGRDCKLTNCPAAASSSTFVSNGITVVVPVGSSTGGTSYQSTALITGTGAASSYPASGTCMDGYASCAQSLLGGCCPQGFTCGAVCTGNVGGGETVVAKMKPNQGVMARGGVVSQFGGWIIGVFGFCVGILMVVL
jgi:hypothetical protein